MIHVVPVSATIYGGCDLQVETKRAVPREESDVRTVPKEKTKKVFLGGISPETTKEDIWPVVQEYGPLIDVQVMTEKGTEKPRGFAFAIFETHESAERFCAKKFHKIKVFINEECCLGGVLLCR